MADVEIAVQAEGVEDAVGEVPPGEAPAGGEEGGLVGGGGGGGAGGGKLGKILGILATVLVAAEDIFKVVGVVSSVLRAFLAPVAVLLLRLLQPFLRAMIGVLPVWFDIVGFISDVAEKVNPLFGILGFLGFLVGSLAGASLSDLLSGFKDKLDSALSGLAEDIGEAIRGKLGLESNEEAADAVSQIPTIDAEEPSVPERLGAAAAGGNVAGPVGAVGSVILQGGLSEFVKRVEKDSGVETP